MKIKFTREEVRKVLEDNPETRNNDLYLFSILLKERNLPTDVTALATLTKTNVFESMGRARRKVQETCPYLQATGSVAARRRQQELIYKEEYGSCNIQL